MDARGGIYLTDPRYSAKPKDQPGEYVYYVDPESMTPTPVLTELVRPNGIVGSADGQRLYVVDDGASTTYRYARRPDGSLGERAVAATAGADGVALDAEGRVYVVDEGLKVFDPEGKKVAEIEAPWVRTNVAFGGKDGRTLFITGKWVVYAIPWRVPGDGF